MNVCTSLWQDTRPFAYETGVAQLGHTAALFLEVWEISRLISKEMFAGADACSSSVLRVSLFLTPVPAFVVFDIPDGGHSDWDEMES